MSRARVLVVDDKENMLKLLRKIIPEDIDVTFAGDTARALGILESSDLDLVVTDIRMPGTDGLSLLAEIKERWPDVEVIVMTGYASVPDAVHAMKRGAYHYLTKPFDPDEALLVIERAVERKQLREQARDLRTALEGTTRFDELLGRSAPMQKMFELMRRAAESDATVLVMGESGTGKELVVRAIHGASRRAAARFLAVNCGALPETLMEAELFGYVKGAFTGAAGHRRGMFEEADGGSLLFDEIGELPLGVQVKLTRVLQQRAVRRVGGTEEAQVNVRVFAATHVELKVAVADGKFREDLYYRLNIFPIRVPPLRERREDVPMLAAVFLERARGERDIEGFTLDALSALASYSWPGNVRELENAIERAVAIADAKRIGIEHLPEEVAGAPRSSSGRSHLAELTYREVVELARDRASREYLLALMRQFSGNVTHAAERAGVERESLHRLLKRFSIRSENYKAKP